MTSTSRVVILGALLCAAPSAQTVSIDFFGVPNGDQAIGVSPNGEYVVGGGVSGGFLWSQAGGFVTLGGGFDAWGVTDDGQTVVGTAVNGMGDEEAAIWTPGGGVQFVGNAGGASGCDFFLSHLNGVSADATTAVGMSWQGCQTSPMRWTQGVGLTLLSKQSPGSSARCYAVADDGGVAVGWDQGGGSNRRASVWLDDSTQVFPTATGANPTGLGEATDVNSDGSIVCGTSGEHNGMFRWAQGLGLSLLPREPSLPGQQVANGISEDGSVVAGVGFTAGFPPNFHGVLWTADDGVTRLDSFLASHGISVAPNDVRNATGVSADGNTIIGWGSQGAFVITIDDAEPWTDLGNGLAGAAGTPALTPGGPLTSGSSTTLELDAALASSTAYLVIGLTALDAPFKGGTLVPDADIVLPIPTSGTGEIDLAFPWPAGLPAGVDTFYQYWIVDGVGPVGFSASNAVQGTTP